MRGVAVAALAILVSAPAFAGPFGHDRMQLPPAAPAFELSNGDPYNKLIVDRVGPPVSKSDLQRVAESIGAGRNGSHADLFRYSLSRDDNNEATSGGAALAGTFSNGGALLQLRWNTSE
jgi:hypothetical protein